jgi:hypothetical protein
MMCVNTIIYIYINYIYIYKLYIYISGWNGARKGATLLFSEKPMSIYIYMLGTQNAIRRDGFVLYTFTVNSSMS